jgi:hypothetical protein
LTARSSRLRNRGCLDRVRRRAQISRVTFSEISEAIAPAGMICCGGFHPLPEDGIESPAATVILIGNVGSAMWRVFAASVFERESGANRLDRWTRDVLTKAARRLNARVLFPFDGPPFHPFMRWAARAEALTPSPIGPLIHPRHGLWQAYRGAFVFGERIDLPAKQRAPSPCEGCFGKPCATGCPVAAIGEDGYDVDRCIAHLRSEDGADCLALGCRARRACPIGADFRHELGQARFHMRAFLAAHGPPGTQGAAPR